MIEKELTVEDIKKLIYVVNNKKVMLDSDIASIFKCANGTKTINQAVKRHIEKFNKKIRFQLTEEENKIIWSQIGTKKIETRGGKYNKPYVYTLDGIETLNSILKSKGSIELLNLFKSTFEDENNIIIKPKALDLSETNIKAMIYNVRGLEVMLDSDLGILYGCENGARTINQAVKRNPERFPEDFYFKLTKDEFFYMLSQFGTTLKGENNKYRTDKKLPYVFTEQGVSMLSSVIKTKNASIISVNIMRAFAEMRKFLASNGHIFERLTNVEYKLLEHDKKFDELFNKFNQKEEIKQRIFFDGEIYDAYSLIIDIIKQANKKILIIDNYIDNSILNMLTKKKDNVEVIILTSNNTKINNLDIEKFNAEYPKLSLKYTNKFHDRFILLDDEILYHLGASIKDLGKKCFGINKIEDTNIIKTFVTN